jgi:hypothetical protein
VEAELAALADLGYDVALRRAYGRSVYRDGTTVANGADFQSALPHGVGLHVYGSFNTVTQEADISSSGPGGAGIRVDGRGNSVTVSRDSEVRAVGPGGSGILVAWGSGHSIASLGAVFGGDDAARFDLGAGIPGLAGGEDAAQADGPGPPGGGGPPRPASFHRPAPGAGPWEREAGEMLDGPLVRSFTVAGLLHGGKRAFYASSDAYVESLGLVRGASVFGDIVSDYDDLGRGTDRATAVYAGGSLGALDRPDPGFSLTLSGRVLGSGRGSGAYSGRGLIDLALVGGTTSLPDSARVDVRGFTLEPGATLELRPDLANLRPIFLEADSVAFKEGSVIRVSESTGLGEARSFFFVPVLKVGKRGDGGFLNLASLELDPASSLSGGELRWYSPGPDEFLLAYVSRGAGLPMAD